MHYIDVLDRAQSAASLVQPPDQPGARRVLHIAREVAARQRDADTPRPSSEDSALKRELNQHFELLGRRGAKALPLAALARSVLADLSGSRRDFSEALNDCHQKLLMFGL
jgi:hypothetical protein